MVSPGKQDGYTLIIVLWSIVILTIIFSYLLDDFLLDNYLIEGYSQQKQIRQAALSAYNMGLNMLLNDETLYDSQKEDWLKPLEGSISDINYTVNINDTGSKININYTPFETLNEIDGWDEEVESYLEENLLADMFILRELIPEEEYQIVKDYTTIYGNYNINYDPPEKLRKLLDFLELADNSDAFISNLENYRNEGREFTNLDELLNLINEFNITSFEEKLTPFLTINGRININLVNEDILKFIFKVNDLDEDTVGEILSYREENEISKMEDFRNLIDNEDFEKIGGMFTTQSYYMLLSVNAEMPEKRNYTIESIIRRNYQDEKWSIKVLSWSEKDIPWSDNNEDKDT